MSKSRGPEFDATMAFVKTTLVIGVLAAAVAVGIRIGREYPVPPEEAPTPEAPEAEERIYAPSMERRSPEAPSGTPTPHVDTAPAAADPQQEPTDGQDPVPPAGTEPAARTLERAPVEGSPIGGAPPAGVAVERTIVREVETGGAANPGSVEREIVVLPQ